MPNTPNIIIFFSGGESLPHPIPTRICFSGTFSPISRWGQYPYPAHYPNWNRLGTEYLRLPSTAVLMLHLTSGNIGSWVGSTCERARKDEQREKARDNAAAFSKEDDEVSFL
jgi:hypothetical protein